MEKLKETWRGFKTWQKALVIFLALAVLGGSLPDEEETASSAKQQGSAESAPATATKETPAKVVKEPEKPFAESELTEEGITKASGLEKVSKVQIIPDAEATDKKIIQITYDIGTTWDENSAVRDVARNAVVAMEKLFAHPAISKVGIWAETKFTDQYGKEFMGPMARLQWSAETAGKVEWKNFSRMVLTEPKRVYLLADDYWIHPGVYQKLKDTAGFPMSK